jgi:hypothetical protein
MNATNIYKILQQGINKQNTSSVWSNNFNMEEKTFKFSIQ